MATHETPEAGVPAPGPAPDLAWLTDRSMDIVLHAINGDGQRAVTALDAVAQRYADRGLYSLYHSLAEVIVRLAGYRDLDGRDQDETGQWWGLRVEHVSTGQPMAPEDMDPDHADMVAAMRWVTAYLNGDTAQLNALYWATAEAPDPAMAARLPLGLIRLVALHGRDHADQGGEQR